MLDEKTIRDDIERASLPTHVHNNFRDYLTVLSTTETAEEDLAHVERIVVRTSMIVNDEDMRDDPNLRLGSRIIIDHVVSRQDVDQWDAMVDLVARSITIHSGRGGVTALSWAARSFIDEVFRMSKIRSMMMRVGSSPSRSKAMVMMSWLMSIPHCTARSNKCPRT